MRNTADEFLKWKYPDQPRSVRFISRTISSIGQRSGWFHGVFVVLKDLQCAPLEQTGAGAWWGTGYRAGAGTELYARGLGKDDEFEADHMSVVIAARADYDPFGLPAMLQVLQGSEPGNSDLALMFKTHPTLSDRLGLLDSLMSNGFEGFNARPNLAARFKAVNGAVKKP